MVSSITFLELDEMMARYASYENFATIVRYRFNGPKQMLRELCSRMLFNVLCGNMGDHAHNHAAFWTGGGLSLTPAYDICPQNRTGGEATQAMFIDGQDRRSQVGACLKAAPNILVSDNDAIEIATKQIQTTKQQWLDICDEAQLSEVDRGVLWRCQFLNPFALLDAALAIGTLVE
jgi:serine/threonine-protein kinase HipA